MREALGQLDAEARVDHQPAVQHRGPEDANDEDDGEPDVRGGGALSSATRAWKWEVRTPASGR